MSKRMSTHLVWAALAAFFAVAAVASANHPVPSINHTGTTAATSFRVPIVPAYKPCRAADQGGTPNGTHSGVPGDSCIHSANTAAAGRARLVSDLVMPGPQSIAWAQVSLKNPNTPSVDVALLGNGTDVRCKVANPGAGCAAVNGDYNPNTAGGPYTAVGSGPSKAPTPPCTSLASCFAGADMTTTAAIPLQQLTGPNAGQPLPPGAVTEHRTVPDRVFQSTDHYNAKNTPPGNACNATKPAGYPAGDVTAPFCQGTTQQEPLPIPVVCTPSGSPSTPPGSSCGFNSTANSIVVGAVVNGKRGVVEFGPIQTYDSGLNRIREFPAPGADDKLVATQGVFLP
jgi:hypothetical protein